MTLKYPLLFPYDEDNYYIGIPYISNHRWKEEREKTMYNYERILRIQVATKRAWIPNTTKRWSPTATIYS